MVNGTFGLFGFISKQCVGPNDILFLHGSC